MITEEPGIQLASEDMRVVVWKLQNRVQDHRSDAQNKSSKCPEEMMDKAQESSEKRWNSVFKSTI